MNERNGVISEIVHWSRFRNGTICSLWQAWTRRSKPTDRPTDRPTDLCVTRQRQTLQKCTYSTFIYLCCTQTHHDTYIHVFSLLLILVFFVCFQPIRTNRYDQQRSILHTPVFHNAHILGTCRRTVHRKSCCRSDTLPSVARYNYSNTLRDNSDTQWQDSVPHCPQTVGVSVHESNRHTLSFDKRSTRRYSTLLC